MIHIECVVLGGHSLQTIIIAVITFRRQVGSAESETMDKADYLVLQNIKHGLPLHAILQSWSLYGL